MGTSLKYKKQIIDLTKDLQEDNVKELISFAQFLKAKQEGLSYSKIDDSAEYVRKLRSQATGRNTTGKNFIEELIKWQKSAAKRQHRKPHMDFS